MENLPLSGKRELVSSTVEVGRMIELAKRICELLSGESVPMVEAALLTAYCQASGLAERFHGDPTQISRVVAVVQRGTLAMAAINDEVAELTAEDLKLETAQGLSRPQ